MDKTKPTYRITDMAESERPRERLARLGAQALNTAELLAILLRVGVKGENAVQVGQRLLQTFGGISGLQRASFDQVCAQHGLAEAKTAQIKAAIELGRRMTLESPEERPNISSPADAAALVLRLAPRYRLPEPTRERRNSIWSVRMRRFSKIRPSARFGA